MIVGIGLDVIEIERVRRLLSLYGERFVARTLTPGERAGLHGDPAAYVAARLAGKEAAFKALGTGWGQGVTWKQVEILRDVSGAPRLHLHGVAARRIQSRAPLRAHVSLTHERTQAAAVVVLESGIGSWGEDPDGGARG